MSLDSPANTVLGQRVKALRIAQGQRPEALATALEIGVGTVWRLEHGYGISSRALAPLAAFFGVSLDYLFGLTETPARQAAPRRPAAASR